MCGGSGNVRALLLRALPRSSLELALILACDFAQGLLACPGMLFGTSLFFTSVNLLQVIAHFFGGTIMAIYIEQAWQYQYLFYIIGFCNFTTALAEIGVLIAMIALYILSNVTDRLGAQGTVLADVSDTTGYLNTLEAAVAWCGLGALGSLVATGSIILILKELADESARKQRGAVGCCSHAPPSRLPQRGVARQQQLEELRAALALPTSAKYAAFDPLNQTYSAEFHRVPFLSHRYLL